MRLTELEAELEAAQQLAKHENAAAHEASEQLRSELAAATTQANCIRRELEDTKQESAVEMETAHRLTAELREVGLTHSSCRTVCGPFGH